MKKVLQQETPAETAETGVPSVLFIPIVGIWASVGGLAAIEAFFPRLPADTDPGN